MQQRFKDYLTEATTKTVYVLWHRQRSNLAFLNGGDKNNIIGAFTTKAKANKALKTAQQESDEKSNDDIALLECKLDNTFWLNEAKSTNVYVIFQNGKWGVEAVGAYTKKALANKALKIYSDQDGGYDNTKTVIIPTKLNPFDESEKNTTSNASVELDTTPRTVNIRELRDIIKNADVNADLNFLDVSQIKNMNKLFINSNFNGDISNWDVSNVTNMSNMFKKSKFDGDISKWDVSKVRDMSYMFYESKFDGDISKWDVSKVRDMSYMFEDSEFNGDISKWDVSKVKNIGFMFDGSPLDGNEPDWYIV